MSSNETPATPAQRRVLEAVQSYWSEHGYPPSQTDIQEVMGFKSKNAVRDHLRELRRKGYVDYEDGVGRSLRVLEAA